AYVAQFFQALQDSFFWPVAIIVAVLVMRVICRRPWLAYVAIYAIAIAYWALSKWNTPAPWFLVSENLLQLTLFLTVISRLGLFAYLVAIVYASWDRFALTANPDAWFFPQSVVTMAVFAAVAVYGFWVSLGSQKVFKESVLN